MTCKECLKSLLCCCKPCNQNYAPMAEGGELKTTENVSSVLEIIEVHTAPTGTDDVPDDALATPPPQNATVSASAVRPESKGGELKTTENVSSVLEIIEVHTAPTGTDDVPDDALATPPPQNATVSASAVRPESKIRPSTLESTSSQPPSPTANVRGNPESTAASRTSPRVRRRRSISPRRSPPMVNVNAAPSIRRGGRRQHAVRTPGSVASQTRSMSPLGSPDGVEPRSLSYAQRGDRKADITPNGRGFEDPGTN